MLPSLAIATLGPLLEAAGIAYDELHCSTLFPVTPMLTAPGFLERAAGFLFAALHHENLDRNRLAARILDIFRNDRNMGVILAPDAQLSSDVQNEPLFNYDLKRSLDAVTLCTERCVEKICQGNYDIIGMSVTFENQIPAALLLADRIKAKLPGTKVILGGAACAGDQGDGLVASFPLLDVVCRTEGESVIVPLVRALRGELPLSEVPGICYRLPDGTPTRTPSPALLMDLDTLPMPDFSAFMEQYRVSEWGPLAPAHITFETSRGCWYGEKHLCSFCGLNGEGLAYRRKSPDRAFNEIRALYEMYPGCFLEATDNILDMGYLKDVLPRLATLPMNPERPLELFFEIKSNLRRDQVHTLVHGHVIAVQPGIETFSDGILELMNKGCTGANQVQFLKWIDEAGIKPTYNLLLRNPGEKASDYREMEALLPFITHLPPPTGLSSMMLERFSPYHSNREAFGITNVRPRPYYTDLYPDQEIDERVAYTFDYDHAMFQDVELLEATRSFARKVLKWQETWKAATLVFIDRGDYLEVLDRRDGRKQTFELRGVAAEVFQHLNSARKPASLRQQFAHVDERVLDSLLAVWRKRRWLCELSGRLLVVVPEFFPHGVPTTRPRKPAAATQASVPMGEQQPAVSAAMR